MSDTIISPKNAARMFAAAVLSEHADTYFERIEVTGIEGLLEGERVFVEFRRVRPDNVSWALPQMVDLMDDEPAYAGA